MSYLQRTNDLVVGVVLAYTFLFTATETLTAQCDSLLQTATQDSGYVMKSRTETGDTVTTSVDEFSPKFLFAYQADSSYSQRALSEFLINRRKLFLSNWCFNRVLNDDSASSGPVED